MDQILNFILKGISVISLEYETFTCFYQKKKKLWISTFIFHFKASYSEYLT